MLPFFSILTVIFLDISKNRYIIKALFRGSSLHMHLCDMSTYRLKARHILMNETQIQYIRLYLRLKARVQPLYPGIFLP